MSTMRILLTYGRILENVIRLANIKDDVSNEYFLRVFFVDGSTALIYSDEIGLIEIIEKA